MENRDKGWSGWPRRMENGLGFLHERLAKCSSYFVIIMWESIKFELDGFKLTEECKLGTNFSLAVTFHFQVMFLLFCPLDTWNIIKSEVIYISTVIQWTKQCYYTAYFSQIFSCFFCEPFSRKFIQFQLWLSQMLI